MKFSEDGQEKTKKKKSPAQEMRERIIKRAALEFKDGMYGILFAASKMHFTKLARGVVPVWVMGVRAS